MSSEIEVFKSALSGLCTAQKITGRMLECGHTVDSINSWLVQLYARLLGENVTPNNDPQVQWTNKIDDILTARTDEWTELASKAKDNILMSSIACMAIADYLRLYMPTPPEEMSQIEELRHFLLCADDYNLPEETIDNIKQKLQALEIECDCYANQVKDWLDRKAEDAIRRGSEAIDNATLALQNSGDLPLPKSLNALSLAAQANMLMLFSNDKTARVLKYLGRLEAACGYRKITTQERPTTGITFGNDVGNLLPEEWLKPDYQFDIEFAEEKLSQYAKGKANVKAGDLIVLFDVSGSMTDPLGRSRTKELPSREVVAKAILLLTWRIARAQKRGFYLITFDGRVRQQIDWRKASVEEVAKFLGAQTNGKSTDIEPPLEAAIKTIMGRNKTAMGKYRKADVLLITDAELSNGRDLVTDEFIAKILKPAQKRTGLRIHGILVGATSAAGQLYRITPTVVKLGDISKEGEVAQILVDL